MYAEISIPLVRRTRAVFRRAEFGFFGVIVRTTVQTPRLKGLLFKAGDFDFTLGALRPLRTNWLTVGIHTSIHFVLPFKFFWGCLQATKNPSAYHATRGNSVRQPSLIALSRSSVRSRSAPPDVIIDRRHKVSRQSKIMTLNSSECQGLALTH